MSLSVIELLMLFGDPESAQHEGDFNFWELFIISSLQVQDKQGKVLLWFEKDWRSVEFVNVDLIM